MPAIELSTITKRYNTLTALHSLDLTIDDGEIFGFLGPNGAGKSTTINILLDFVRPTSGSAHVLGMDAQEETSAVHEKVGVLPEGFELYDRLTAHEHLRFAMRTKGVSADPDSLLDRVGLDPSVDRPVGGFSKGMRQRLALAIALVGEPELLILDEPSSGLDPNGARDMRRIVREENDRGATVFFSSHILEQVDAVCDRVGIMHEGELISVGTVDELRDQLGSSAELAVSITDPDRELVQSLATIDGVGTVDASESILHIECQIPQAKAASIKLIHDAGHTIDDISIEERSLEDLFAALTTEEAIAA